MPEQPDANTAEVLPLKPEGPRERDAASAPPSSVPPSSPTPPKILIWDEPFERAHKRLRRLSGFVLEVPASFADEVLKAARLGGLNMLEYAALPSRGRRATVDEWSEVEERTHAVWAALSDAQRRRFLTTQVPGWFAYAMSAFMVMVLASVLVAFLVRTSSEWQKIPGVLLLPFMAFVVSLGAIGASASIGMNALSVQEDATFDISNGKFLWLRIVLGALFGATLTFPWAFPVFQTFITTLQSSPSSTVAVQQAQFVQALWLLTPFILGFSTSLVILVLSRAVESVQTFFGKVTKEPVSGR